MSTPSTASATGAAGIADQAPEVLTAADLGTALGERATVVQLSSAFCVPCRRTRVVVEHAVRTQPGVVHVELDVADHLALGERLHVLSTPTVLVLDAAGRVRRRAVGVPTLAQVRAALADATA